MLGRLAGCRVDLHQADRAGDWCRSTTADRSHAQWSHAPLRRTADALCLYPLRTSRAVRSRV